MLELLAAASTRPCPARCWPTRDRSRRRAEACSICACRAGRARGASTSRAACGPSCSPTPTRGNPLAYQASRWACTRGDWSSSGPGPRTRPPDPAAGRPLLVGARGAWRRPRLRRALTGAGLVAHAHGRRRPVGGRDRPTRRRRPAAPPGRARRAAVRDMHGTGPKGFYITPSLRPDYRGTHGLDSYAAAIGYSGLALATLNWAIDRFGTTTPPLPRPTPPPPARPGPHLPHPPREPPQRPHGRPWPPLVRDPVSGEQPRGGPALRLRPGRAQGQRRRRAVARRRCARGPRPRAGPTARARFCGEARARAFLRPRR